MAVVATKPRARLSRNQFVALVAAAVLVALYVYFAAYLQPLAAGSDETLYRAPGQATLNDPAMSPVIDNAEPGHTPILLSYVDGAESSLVKTFYNDGPTPITIT